MTKSIYLDLVMHVCILDWKCHPNYIPLNIVYTLLWRQTTWVPTVTIYTMDYISAVITDTGTKTQAALSIRKFYCPNLVTFSSPLLRPPGLPYHLWSLLQMFHYYFSLRSRFSARSIMALSAAPSEVPTRQKRGAALCRGSGAATLTWNLNDKNKAFLVLDSLPSP